MDVDAVDVDVEAVVDDAVDVNSEHFLVIKAAHVSSSNIPIFAPVRAKIFFGYHNKNFAPLGFLFLKRFER